jgi:GTP-binding protein
MINNPKFIKSAADAKGFFKSEKPQIAVAGKSNVGKSSFINMMAAAGNLAVTSARPGRTRLINYFDMGGFVLADLPGYGFAEAPKDEIRKWGTLAGAFFEDNPLLKGVIALVDIRHDPTELDLQLISYLYAKRLPFVIIATKADKLSKSNIPARVNGIAAKLGVGKDNILPVSNTKKTGRKQALALIKNLLGM